MKTVLTKLWLEPAAFIGLLVTVLLTAGAFATDTDWDWEAVVAVLAPLLTGLGIRQTVVPTPKAAAGNVPAQPAGTTYRTSAEKDR
jgi:hypothetical protein